MFVVAVVAARGIAVRPVGIVFAIALAMCAVAGVVFLVDSGEGIMRDLSVALVCLSVWGLWSDPFGILPIAVPTLWRHGVSMAFLAIAGFFAIRALRRVSRLG
ncbi:MAG: hypothetical protein JWM95_2449 [Gemmatimonadetes bacterium]|nr:hypothetical protein [Gemmatimonadota bacterium]